jgi:hypothetical protein
MRGVFSLAAGLTAAAIFTTAAHATVTFDPATGKGFVGKGDVQLVFGWNNAQLQKKATTSGAIVFTYSESTIYSATCEWTTGEGTRGEKVHSITRTKFFGVLGSVAYDARQRSQVTGFNLNGWTSYEAVQGTVPIVGESCPGEGTNGVWTVVIETSSSSGLQADDTTDALPGVKIWPPAI